MPAALITLTTDFGTDSPYVAAMKGVLLGLSPDARLVDLSHSIAPQSVVQGAFFLAEAAPFFPDNTLHVVVVDPGVGTSRALLYAEAGGLRFLAPDNGVWTLAGTKLGVKRVLRLEDAAYWRANVSPTFHGRDILASVAGHLANGLDPQRLGPAVSSWVKLALPALVEDRQSVRGEVVYVDRFGNLITNIPGSAVEPTATVQISGTAIDCFVSTYGLAAPGTLVALLSSGGWLEVAVVNGSAAERLHAQTGTEVRLLRH
jgi:hypothetical protein